MAQRHTFKQLSPALHTPSMHTQDKPNSALFPPPAGWSSWPCKFKPRRMELSQEYILSWAKVPTVGAGTQPHLPAARSRESLMCSEEGSCFPPRPRATQLQDPTFQCGSFLMPAPSPEGNTAWDLSFKFTFATKWSM